MNITIDSKGLDHLILRLEGVQREMLPAIAVAMVDIGNIVENALARQAPHGAEQGPPPAGDAPGPLALSFVPTVTQTQDSAKLVISTTQPTKLTFVRKGTGIYGPKHRRIVPTQAKALWWHGAQHPVRSVKGMKGHDFVAPVLREAKHYAREQLSLVMREKLRFGK